MTQPSTWLTIRDTRLVMTDQTLGTSHVGKNASTGKKVPELFTPPVKKTGKKREKKISDRALHNTKGKVRFMTSEIFKL